MSGVKKDLETQELKRLQREEIVREHNGEEQCSRCGESFVSVNDTGLCNDCWKEISS
ncbi:hypothetical protein [uncultured Enterococcus sp.]|uniref:hypothetical protein n=1 Tax=uncultured Enterococcus sp. TaxID=167972 RepID=UPI002AA82625|nr:hypothetical protein [uncultured Enterococcus sp.]